jgi:hypothetical protein
MPKRARLGDTYVDEVNGYIFEFVKGHPLFPGKRWVYQHRRVLAEKLGRELKRWEIAHHKDENGFNNKPGNIIYTTRRKHPTLHAGITRSESVKKLMSLAAKKRCTGEWRKAVSKRVKRQHKEGKFGRRTWKILRFPRLTES